MTLLSGVRIETQNRNVKEDAKMMNLVNISQSTTLGSEHDGKGLLIDATIGSLTLSLPAASTLSAGWHVPVIFKTDSGSGLVGFKCTVTGDTLNHFWSRTSPYPLWINLTQGSAELLCDGVSKFFLMDKSFQRSIPQSQRTGTVQSINIRPQDNREIWRVNCQSAGGDVGMYFDPVAHFTGGGYHSQVVTVAKVDDSASKIRIFHFLGDTFLKPYGGLTYLELSEAGEVISFYIASDGIEVLSWFKPSQI